MVIDATVHLVVKCHVFEPGSQSDMRRASILSIALAMLLLSAASALANNTWNGYHWADEPHDGSISLTLVDHLDAYGTEYGQARDDWDQGKNGGNGPLALSEGTAAGRPAACDNVATDAAGRRSRARSMCATTRMERLGGWVWLGSGLPPMDTSTLASR